MQTLISVFGDRDDARRAVERLLAAGFAQADLQLRADGTRRVVLVDARTDPDAEMAAIILRDQGAVEMDDRESSGGAPFKRGVRIYKHEPRAPLARKESLLADRAGQVSKERAYAHASAMTITSRDRPK